VAGIAIFDPIPTEGLLSANGDGREEMEDDDDDLDE
jgi:hypothetical protein